MSRPAILCVPAHKPEWEAPARESGAWILWDLEDGVPAKCKAQAQENIHKLARHTDLVRVNRGERLDTDATVVYPKVDLSHLPRRQDQGIIIESPTAVRDVEEILTTCKPSIVLFGWADLLACSGLTPGNRSFLNSCRNRVVLACRGRGIPVYDGPPLGEAGPAASRARRQGFTGMGCIHPQQVPAVTEAFNRTTREEADFLGAIEKLETLPPPLATIERTIHARS